MANKVERIAQKTLSELKESLLPLIGTQFESLALPAVAMPAFEPSQIGTIVGSLMDALIPHIDNITGVGLSKSSGTVGQRESYPDYEHTSGNRVELKLLYIDNKDLKMKRPPTLREPSARLTQKVTVKNVRPDKDALLLIAYQLNKNKKNEDSVTPTIVDLEVFSVIDLVDARDKRLTDAGGKWFGDFDTPCVLSKRGKARRARELDLRDDSYGRKEAEEKDYNEDTNFGKLNRIPDQKLQQFLLKCMAISVGVADSKLEADGGVDKVEGIKEPKAVL